MYLIGDQVKSNGQQATVVAVHDGLKIVRNGSRSKPNQCGHCQKFFMSWQQRLTHEIRLHSEPANPADWQPVA